jgi:hypothetical protein
MCACVCRLGVGGCGGWREGEGEDWHFRAVMVVVV